MPASLNHELKTAILAALKAGKIISRYYHKSYQVTEKGFDQPVTEADIAANTIIKKIITKDFPFDGWLSEEDVANPDRFHAKRVWIVDPLDGTKEFIQKNPQFAVSIALVEEQSPLLGVIYNPISRELFWAIKGGGSFFQKQPLSVTKTVLSDKPHLLVSVSEHKRGDWTKFESLFSLIPRGGSAYKMVGIAQGLAEGSFTLCPKNEWDICAGHLIIEEAGGFVCNLDGSPITYNKPITGMDGVIYGCSEEMKKRILSVIVPPYPQPLIKCTSIPRK